jgi:hypothetical protein
VRFSPNQLSFITPKAFKGLATSRKVSINRFSRINLEIYGFQANVRKADALVATQSEPETVSTLSDPYKKSALAKRRILSQGFSESALKHSEGYYPDNYVPFENDTS